MFTIHAAVFVQTFGPLEHSGRCSEQECRLSVTTGKLHSHSQASTMSCLLDRMCQHHHSLTNRHKLFPFVGVKQHPQY